MHQRARDEDALTALRDYLSRQGLSQNEKLPVERELSQILGFSRGKLRKALSVLESEGVVWRHVGRGTFTGPRPVHNLDDVSFLSEKTSLSEIMEARLAVEPQMARLAALNGTEKDFAEIRRCCRRARRAEDWRTYEAWDTNLHMAIAKATQNTLLISLFDTLNVVRRSTEVRPERKSKGPPPDHKSFEEHDRILKAIAGRDPELAAQRMREHLRTVRARFF